MWLLLYLHSNGTTKVAGTGADDNTKWEEKRSKI